MYTARRGKGAFCNGVPIKVSGQEGEYSNSGVAVTNISTRWSQTSTVNFVQGANKSDK